MTRWLLNTFHTWQLALLIVGGTALIAGTAQRVTRKKFPGIATQENHDLVSRLLTVLMAMYGLLLAFVIVSLYQDFTGADRNVQFEAVQLSNMYRDSRVFEQETADAMVEAIGAYTDTLFDEEWELMEAGEMSPQSSEDLTRLYELLQSYKPQTVTQEVFYSEAVGALNNLNLARRTRRDDAQGGLPPAFLILIIGGAIIVLGFLVLFSTSDSWAQTGMITAVAAIIGLNLFLVVSLDHPFSGDVAVSIRPFNEGSLGDIREQTK